VQRTGDLLAELADTRLTRQAGREVRPSRRGRRGRGPAGARWPRMAVMARPVIVVVDDEDASRQALARELEGR
jgi:hypothetical protein